MLCQTSKLGLPWKVHQVTQWFVCVSALKHKIDKALGHYRVRAFGAPHPYPLPQGEGVKTVEGEGASLTGQGRVNRLGVEPTETLVTNDNNRQRA